MRREELSGDHHLVGEHRHGLQGRGGGDGGLRLRAEPVSEHQGVRVPADHRAGDGGADSRDLQGGRQRRVQQLPRGQRRFGAAAPVARHGASCAGDRLRVEGGRRHQGHRVQRQLGHGHGHDAGDVPLQELRDPRLGEGRDLRLRLQGELLRRERPLRRGVRARGRGGGPVRSRDGGGRVRAAPRGGGAARGALPRDGLGEDDGAAGVQQGREAVRRRDRADLGPHAAVQLQNRDLVVGGEDERASWRWRPPCCRTRRTP